MDIGWRLSAPALALILLAGALAPLGVGPSWAQDAGAQGAGSEGDDSRAPEASSAARDRPVGGAVNRPVNRNGIYRGGDEFIAGSSYHCRGFNYTFEVTDRVVWARLTPAASSREVGGSFQAPLGEDGTVSFSYSSVGGSGVVDIQLTLDGDIFTGYSQSMRCRYKITTKRS